MLRYKADVRSIVYMIITTILFVFMWSKGATLNTWVWTLSYVILLHFSVAVAVMAHNHNHLSMWKNKWMNVITDMWLTVFYGFPVFAWIPTHNSNHHKYVNKEEDYTKTYRFTDKNNLLTLLSYPSVSGYYQQPEVMKYWKETYKRNKEKFVLYTIQFIVLITWLIVFISLDWRKAILYVVIPQQVSLFFVLLFNYIQHVHADEETKYNSSRNWVGTLNVFLFNNGLHTIHHVYPTLHWSETPEEHEKIAHKIDPSLIETSFWGFLFKSYILSIFIPKYRTKSMRQARIEGHPVVTE